jgi:hypothetical protein
VSGPEGPRLTVVAFGVEHRAVPCKHDNAVGTLTDRSETGLSPVLWVVAESVPSSFQESLQHEGFYTPHAV